MRGHLRHVALVGTMVAALAAASCSRPHRARGPEAVLAEFQAALAKGDTRAAYALLSREAQARLTQAQFDAQLRDNPGETAALQRDLTNAGPARVSAQIRLPAGGQIVQLARESEGDGFRIQSALTDYYPQATPREALQSFLRAVERSRWDVLLELMPDADRDELDAETLGKHLTAQKEELTRLVALLKTAQDAPIEIVGERATLPYGESFTARFLLENGRWKVEDPE